MTVVHRALRAFWGHSANLFARASMNSLPFKYPLLITCLALCSVFGCVRRRLTIRSNPPGASAYVDHQLIGQTPAAVNFQYYLPREIELVADGYRTEKVIRSLRPPWYQIPPLDFFAETLWPWELRDEHVIDVSMVPMERMSEDELQARGDNLRLQAAQGIAVPLPPPAVVNPDFRQPGQEVRPLDPTFEPYQPPVAAPEGPAFRPFQFFQNLIAPTGQPPTRIPEAGILPGGGYRPPVE